MQKTAFKSVYLIILRLCMIAAIGAVAGAADNADVYDTIELKNGEMVTGTVLNDTFTIMTPYTTVALEKDNISEIEIDVEHENHDVITLNAGGLMEGTIEEAALSIKLVSGKLIALEKGDCKKISLKSKKQ